MVVPAAVLYLALPNLIFLITWLNGWGGIPAAIIVAGSCVMLLKLLINEGFSPGLDFRTTVWVFLIALFWTCIAGVGGLIPQCQGEDYVKHNLVFHDLIHRDWPVTYDAPGGGKSFLCYSVGYYLVPALVARWLGEGWVNGAAFIWTYLGVWLFFYWLAGLNRKAPIRTLLLFLYFAGLGTLWLFIRNCGLNDATRTVGLTFSNPDWWAKLSFAPQHTLATLLGAALLYDRIWLNQNPRGSLLIWALVFLWSPMTPFGLIIVPFLALPRLGVRQFIEPLNAIGGATVLFVMVLFYHAHIQLENSGWIWSHESVSKWLPVYFLFVLVEVIIPVVCILTIDQKYDILQNLRPLFRSSAVILVLLPLYKIGFYNDLRLQVSGPLLFFVSLAAAKCLTSPVFSPRKAPFALFIGVYVIGSFYPLLRPVWVIATKKHDFSYEYGLREGGASDLSQFRWAGQDFSGQYLGKTDSIAYRYLLKH